MEQSSTCPGARSAMIVIYALGGGYGHTSRALAIRRCAPPDADVRVIGNNWDHHTIMKTLGALTPLDTLIVDVYPRGLNGELTLLIPKLKCKKILVQRYLDEKAYTS